MNKARKDKAGHRWAALGEDLGEMLVIVTTPIPVSSNGAWFDIEVWENDENDQ
jgi:hypothetical protein